ncbi:helix-turn-helix domain-containing protein [Pseudodesulfovibrio piezophilus]|uniref:helix-turn-helix domain-containing protein n=1 Tax=Pseudodesulfovibrio piezophilus TaxID=879567 RepID=UPI0012FEF45F|nr:helix-turn-helix domain-containing protein [Pseudodesulfovibrio piezophilus]
MPYKLFVGLFIPDIVASFDGLQLSSKLVWGKLAQHAGETGDCFPGVDTIAEGLGCSGRTVQRCLNELIEKKFIEVERCFRKKSRLQTTNRYYFLWHPIFDSALTRTKQESDRVTKSRPRDDKKSPLGATKSHPSNGDKMSPKENQYLFEENPQKRTRTKKRKGSSGCLSSEVLRWIDICSVIKKDADAYKAKMVLLGEQGKLNLDLLEKEAEKVAQGERGSSSSQHRAVIEKLISEGRGEDFIHFLDATSTPMITIGGLSFDTDVARSMVVKTMKELGE